MGNVHLRVPSFIRSIPLVIHPCYDFVLNFYFGILDSNVQLAVEPVVSLRF